MKPEHIVRLCSKITTKETLDETVFTIYAKNARIRFVDIYFWWRIAEASILDTLMRVRWCSWWTSPRNCAYFRVCVFFFHSFCCLFFSLQWTWPNMHKRQTLIEKVSLYNERLNIWLFIYIHTTSCSNWAAKQIGFACTEWMVGQIMHGCMFINSDI